MSDILSTKEETHGSSSSHSKPVSHACNLTKVYKTGEVEVKALDGVVLTRYRESAGVINAAQPIMDVGDPSNLEVKVELISTEAVRVARARKYT